MNSKLKGSIGELAVAQDLMRQGYPVFTELGDTSKVDLIALIGDRAVKIQVKTGTEVKGVTCFTKFRADKYHKYIYNKDDCDVFALYNLDRDIVCYFGWDTLDEANCFNIRYDDRIGKRSNGMRVYTDYLDIHKTLNRQSCPGDQRRTVNAE